MTAHDVNGNVASDASDADFTFGQYLLTVNVANGTVERSPDLAAYDYGTEVALTAIAASGYHFEEWSGDVTGPANPVTITMDNHKEVTAKIVINPPVEPITALAVSQVRNGNDTNGTTKVTLSWPPIPAGTVVEVYRAGFGGYPRYDDVGGMPPALPSHPPPTPWALTSVNVSGMTDEPPERDYWHYVAFVTDQYGTLSPASNLAGGVLNYHLGDVANGITPGEGDNQVDIADISLLGSHYGISGVDAIPYAYLDVGPTTDRSVHGRPLTDGRINIEDLILFALNYGVVSAPGLKAQRSSSGPDELALRVTELPPDAVVAHLQLHGSGAIQALSATLNWNPAVLEPSGFATGQLLQEQGGVALSPGAGSVDATLLGVQSQGMTGRGDIATLTFRRLRPGDDGIGFKSTMARNAANEDVPLIAKRALTPTPIPTVTALAAPSPNPFLLSTTLTLGLARSGPVELVVLAVDGRRVRTLVSSIREAGEHRVKWDGRDDAGQRLPAGIYHVRLRTVEGKFLRKVAHLH